VNKNTTKMANEKTLESTGKEKNLDTKDIVKSLEEWKPFSADNLVKDENGIVIGTWEEYPPESGKIGKRFVPLAFGVDTKPGQILVSKSASGTKETDVLLFVCPHVDCGEKMSVERAWINCKIFRHGHDRKTCVPINPHAGESECEALRKTGNYCGCIKPLRYVVEGDKEYVEPCGYNT
jgi:hypothetical protein